MSQDPLYIRDCRQMCPMSEGAAIAAPFGGAAIFMSAIGYIDMRCRYADVNIDRRNRMFYDDSRD